MADRAVHICREFPPCALFGGHRPAHCPLECRSTGCRIVLPDRPAICRSRAQGRGRKSRIRLVVFRHGRAALYVLCRTELAGSAFRPIDRQSAGVRSGPFAADLFSVPGHGVQASAVMAAGGAGQRGGFDPGIRNSRLAVACFPRCAGRNSGRGRRTGQARQNRP